MGGVLRTLRVNLNSGVTTLLHGCDVLFTAHYAMALWQCFSNIHQFRHVFLMLLYAMYYRANINGIFSQSVDSLCRRTLVAENSMKLQLPRTAEQYACPHTTVLPVMIMEYGASRPP